MSTSDNAQEDKEKGGGGGKEEKEKEEDEEYEEIEKTQKMKTKKQSMSKLNIKVTGNVILQNNVNVLWTAKMSNNKVLKE